MKKPLTDLAARINAEHKAVTDAAKDATNALKRGAERPR
jgi:hypothetical protein